MKKYHIMYVIICAILLSAGCAEKQDENPAARRKKSGKKKKSREAVNVIKEFEQEKYEYKGGKYKSPFSSSGKGAVSSVESKSAADSKIAVLSNPETLKVTGFFSDNSGTYAILSGVNEFFIVKKGRLYNEDRLEVPGVAAIVKKDKIILITGKDTMFELAIPQ